ncbi:LysR family transcriptional regulator [Kitasatospora sp. NBC_01287]|uniref:LysR family transcriptional regulator n=1 Tax=Kitasatospora sp. NBC_01287 TaxID=2903573 RepID=UPI00224FE03A|nr:LysR family transcriptional regulator [Kitasatospora sp. NBC_01287]MCX4747028.1 LysR family transcriptional regulator [Kitasatospora sp. NBC_01287]
MDLDPKRLLVLHAVADFGGITAAARRLGVTPSAVSQALARLEQEARVPLVDRRGARSELTAAGRALAARGRRIAEELERAERELALIGAPVAGPVVIGAVPSYLPVVCHALVLLAERHPLLEPEVRELRAEEPELDCLRDGEVDLAVLPAYDLDAPPTPAGMVYQLLLRDTFRVVVPPQWPGPSGFADLAGAPWIVGAPGSAVRRVFERLAAEHGLNPGRRHVATARTATQTLLRGGLGAAVVQAAGAAVMRGAWGLTVTGLPVPGLMELRGYYRTGADGPSPVVEAVVSALARATQEASLAVDDLGVLEREPYLLKPSLSGPFN